MNIVAILPVYPPGARIGAFIATHQLLAACVTAGHTVTVHAYTERGRGWEIDGVTVDTGLRGRSHGARLARAADVVVSHAGDHGVGHQIAREARVPSVRMYHGAGHHVGDDPADLVVYNSSSARTAAIPARYEVVCRPWTNLDLHRTAPGDLVTIVNLSEAKGVRTAWRAAEDLPHVGFLGVRGGYDRQIVPRAKNFETIPAQTDMRTVWARTRVLLMPSAHETWGMVGVEAMACGIPVIAHPTPGLREMLGNAGLLADRNDRATWANAIRYLADPDVWARHSTLARERADSMPDDRPRFVEAVERIAARVPA